VSIEEKVKAVIELSAELELALMMAAHELRDASIGTPKSREIVEQVVRVCVHRSRYDDGLRRLVEGAAAAGHLKPEYIQGVIEGLQDKRDESLVLHKLFVLGERSAQASN
jgi:hypothetical protein